MIDALEIGYAIKDQHTRLGVTQAQVADAAGVSKRCLWSLELGQNPGVQLDKLTAALNALGLDLTISQANSPKVSQNSKPDEVETPEIELTIQQHNANECPDALAILTGAAR